MIMNFCDALRFIINSRAGTKVARKAWINKSNPEEQRYICKSYNDGKYFIHFHFKVISSNYEKHQLFTPSQEDMVSDDWYIVEN